MPWGLSLFPVMGWGLSLMALVCALAGHWDLSLMAFD